ncbi:hypothetical protein ACA910_015167 [Epithemia clementina (nom. ined.)]
MTSSPIPILHPLLVVEPQASISPHINDPDASVEDSDLSSLPGTPSRRSRRRRKKPIKMEGGGASLVIPSVPTIRGGGGGGRVPLSRPCAWGNETQMLEEALSRRTSTLFSMEDDTLRRFAVDHLEKLLAKWSPKPETSRRSAPSESTPSSQNNPWQRTRPTLVTFGSYRLGVHRDDSDLDLLALCPPEFSRGDFFQSWVELLKSDSLISKVHPIPQAYTPVIKFFFKEKIQVDMLFARLADGKKLREFQQRRVAPNLFPGAPGCSVISNGNAVAPRRTEYPIDDSDLKEQDEAGVRSLNGARVSQMLLEMVPDLNKFRTVLRAVKEWAVSKGIYSNVLGFLGGVNFAILVARICKENPHADAPALLKYFFQTYWNWNWRDPVQLLPIQSQPPEGAPLMPAWDPQRNPRDGLHIMPIITPAYPSMNSSYNVGIPQLRRLSMEMYEAFVLLSSAPLPPSFVQNNSTSGRSNVFSKLFEPSTFFASHEHFLQVSIRASHEQDFMEWFRLVESKMRLLISSLETPDISAWPYSCFFECKYDSKGNATGELGRSDKDCLHESLFFIALRFAPAINDLNLVPYVSEFLHKVNSWPGRKPGMDLSLAHVLSSNLPAFVRPAMPLDISQKENNRGNHGAMYHRGYRGYGGGNQYKKKDYYKKDRKSFSTKPTQQTTSGTVKSMEEGNIPCSSSSSSMLSCERAETEETQSMASDVSFAESNPDSNASCSSGSHCTSHTNNKIPMKRICVVGNSHRSAQESAGGGGDSRSTTTEIAQVPDAV